MEAEDYALNVTQVLWNTKKSMLTVLRITTRRASIPKIPLGGGGLPFFTGEVAARRLVRGLEAGGGPAAGAFLAFLERVAGVVKA